MRVLHVGDVVGKPGREIVCAAIGGLRRRERLDFVICNSENAAGGSGLNPAQYQEIIAAGVDCITLGDHIFKRREIGRILATQANIVKPANYPSEAPGHDHTVLQTASGKKIAVISLMGRVFMKPVDCPFKAADRVLGAVPHDVKTIFVDFHAEATSDKQLMGRYLDGRVTSVLGTHTHVTTADEQILPGGTAFQCDLGMTGPHDSILGRRYDRVIETTITFNPTAFDVAKDDVQLHGTIVDVDDASGRATAIRRLVVPMEEAQQLAALR
ncbi:MAG: TIGR00282 family metallophosphoesterase [Pirellulales bacterium]